METSDVDVKPHRGEVYLQEGEKRIYEEQKSAEGITQSKDPKGRKDTLEE